MRNFVMLLLLLNLVYLAFNTGLLGAEVTEPSSVEVVTVQRNTENRLSLLKEAALDFELTRRGASGIEGQETLLENSSEFSLNTVSNLSSGLTQEVNAIDTPVCVSIGSFENSDSADALALELRALDYFAEVSERSINVRQNYWLYMPPFNSMVAARQQLDLLRESNIDSYIITEEEGELAQGISLGLFAQRESAVTLQAQYAQLGFPSSISEVFRSSSEYWLDVDALLAPEFAEFTRLEALNAISELKVEEKLCETIAP